jgi:hypothetical protein
MPTAYDKGDLCQDFLAGLRKDLLVNSLGRFALKEKE